jgi:PAS domain S-box-containing protein
MTFLLVGTPGAEAALDAVRDRLAAAGHGDVVTAPAPAGPEEGAPVLLVDGGGEAAWGPLQQALADLVRRGASTLVLLDAGRGPEAAATVFRLGAADLLLWPRDADFLPPRLAALVDRRWTLRWPTSVESELRLLHAITMAISAADSFAGAMSAVLRRLCEATGWVLGQAWVRRMGSGQLECSPAWYGGAPGLEAFRAATEAMTFDLGVGLPGQVWATQQRVWLNDVSVEPCFRRAPEARLAGLKAGFFVPVMAEGQVVSVLEFFVTEVRPEDERLLTLVTGLALQLGSIIERKRIEEAYRLLTTAVEQMGEAVAITTVARGGAEPEIIFTNAAFTAMTGYGRDEVVGRTAQLLFGADAGTRWERWAPSPGDQLLHGETVSRRKDGTAFDLDWRIAPVWDRSGGHYLIANLREITDRKRVERTRADLERALNKAAVEWRQTFDAIDFPIFILDQANRIRRLNRAAQMISGRSFQENLGRLIDSVGAGEPWRRASGLVSAMAGETAAEVLQDDASGLTWEIVARRFRAEGERPASGAQAREEPESLILLVARDITPTIRLRDSLRRSQTMAAMGSLVAGVAHEVRNPLFGISATLDAFEARFGSQPGFQTYTAVLRGEVTRMSELMRDLLEFGKQPDDARSAGAIADVIEHAVAGCAAIAERSRVQLVRRMTPRLPPLSMDFGRLVQVFQNLIENAIQHSPEEGTVTVTAALEAGPAGPQLRATVEDEGPGFRPEDLSRVFEPFFTRRRGGTGLGLSIVHRILEQHGGTARVQNRSGGGGQVILALPLAAARSEESDHAA